MADCLRNPVNVNGTATLTSASIGIVIAEHGQDLEQAIANADLAMYEAKAAGRGRYEIYDEELRTRLHEFLDFEEHLRRAVERGEFVTYYQPVVRLADEAVHGVEALVRWQHPERGLIPPDKFIPTAEESGLISSIGKAVLFDAGRAVAEHNLHHRAQLDLAVNVSPHQLDDPTFTHAITTTIRDTGLDPNHLIVEVTESAVINHLEEAAAVLTKLKELGIRIAMDDFGTGFSSLTYLSKLPIDIVKIDRSFVSTMNEDPANAQIVSAICSLSRSMGLHVIAEGVETRAQHQLLLAFGAHSAQGYLYGRPQPTI